jgi:hypothetical protein
MIAGMLHRAGVSMGLDLIGPHPTNNPTGHFEDYWYHRLNREIVWTMDHHACLTDETLRNYRFDSTMRRIAPIIDEYQLRLERHNNGAMWGMKCIFLGAAWPYMQHLLPDDRKIVMVHRRWPSIIDSRQRHGDMAYETAEQMTTWLYSRIYRVLSNESCPIYHIQYEDVIADPEDESQMLCDWLGGDLDVTAAHPFVRPELDHHSRVLA